MTTHAQERAPSPFSFETEAARVIAHPHLYHREQVSRTVKALARLEYIANAARSDDAPIHVLFERALERLLPGWVAFDCDTCRTAAIVRKFTDPCPTCGE